MTDLKKENNPNSDANNVTVWWNWGGL